MGLNQFKPFISRRRSLNPFKLFILQRQGLNPLKPFISERLTLNPMTSSGIGDRTFYYIIRALRKYDECIYAIPGGIAREGVRGEWSIVLTPAEMCDEVGHWWVYIYPDRNAVTISFRPNRARYEARLDLVSGRAVITRWGEVVREAQTEATIELARAIREYIVWSTRAMMEIVVSRGRSGHEA